MTNVPTASPSILDMKHTHTHAYTAYSVGSAEKRGKKKKREKEASVMTSNKTKQQQQQRTKQKLKRKYTRRKDIALQLPQCLSRSRSARIRRSLILSRMNTHRCTCVKATREPIPSIASFFFIVVFSSNHTRAAVLETAVKPGNPRQRAGETGLRARPTRMHAPPLP